LVSQKLRIVAASILTDLSPTPLHTLSLHDALPISRPRTRRIAGSGCEPDARRTGRGSPRGRSWDPPVAVCWLLPSVRRWRASGRSEEHTSELQSPYELVCRLLLEKKKTSSTTIPSV